MMKLIAVLLLVVFTTFTTSHPDNLQDICVADLASAIIVNGFPCKPATTVTAADFSSKILANPGATTNTTFGSTSIARDREYCSYFVCCYTTCWRSSDQVLAQTFKASIQEIQTVKARFAP
ncbi:GRR1-like protein 1, variant 2 [Trifolium repens]|nr:GRR1-like protein 1, variant 2 [Trifolium repens]